jgi:signal-transduction protein with cAMP-binding, CBS, and nucleotidyltransferase domain
MFEQVIANHPFFMGMGEYNANLIAGHCINTEFKPGEFIFKSDTPAQQFYIIQHGKVALEIAGAKNGSVIIQTLREGDVLGWSWLFAPYRWHFDARSVEHTIALLIEGKWLREYCEQDHDLGYILMNRVAQLTIQRLQATRLQVLDLYGKSSERR